MTKREGAKDMEYRLTCQHIGHNASMMRRAAVVIVEVTAIPKLLHIDLLRLQNDIRIFAAGRLVV
jgi:hypothetical protein